MGKTALVTGASRGIGKEIALTLGKNGYNVVVNYNSSAAPAEALVQEIKACGSDAIAIQADVSKSDEIKKLVDESIKTFGKLDLLVNNAGITRDNLLVLMKESQWNEVIQTNLLGVVEITQLVCEQMEQQGSGKIINIASVVGVHGNAGQANYSTAKAGVVSLTKIKARKLMPKIQVNCIAPGLVETDMTKDFELKNLGETKLGRAGKPTDIADCVLWLANSGDYVTGQVIEIDGGLSLYSNVKELAS